ncbi:Mitochondrial zinc maintenance protein 1, mitochondrial [Friedmanniomyces endolithicus]|uniref:Mitochondrial zinc maintenance protein 1, mitochondrial n=2 Tax=Dothideomycetidae TaxID=451867 RepID=A0A4U0UR73_9PEZI|nr:Mitochondrial zinc maintenance protein 1, mitochondrial [Friedmanniomyces endolithicus]KAK5144825.1 Mitochondrial zinc maintenance protein 1, mitochondrial [Rachicladosporium monterosium]KAK0278518.1 Mitochondrial zinc maintenance protein 1, mitochondrial [Friedmanniomyces endolithicus]KAK0292317.1 Mitochondrial zinc maintenance protein 1, mitochondrial [Friedmanniomyces endolithicus]KAK0320313.1 Mitochondrial zinc maintenance protein 1, mitochondrial [Friedmanniomyces endolithicus]
MTTVDLLRQFMASKSLSPAEIATNRVAVLATYRHLLRAINLSFANDPKLHPAAHRLAHESFAKTRRLDSGSIEALEAVKHAQSVAQILRENVVQGRKVGAEGEEKYKLRFTEHTQLRDNDEAGRLRGTTKTFREIRDAQT